MNRKNSSAKPKIPMSQDEQMPEIRLAIMPDYPKWNRLFYQLDCLFVIINFLLGSTFFIFSGKEMLIEPSLRKYAFQNSILPSVLNVAILLAAAALRKRLPETDTRQNAIPVFTMLLLSFVVSLMPQIFFITLGIFCIPICMTTVYSNHKMCRIVTLVSLAGTLIASIRQFVQAAAPQEQMVVFPQSLIAVCILLTLGKVAQTAIKMTEGQKQKLIRFAMDIKEEQRRAEAANEAKSIFLANMSHEIRTPINAILGMNEMILRENRNEQIEEYATNIDSAGSSLLYLVNDVLDISKIESGKLEIIENIYELSSFIHDCYNMIAEKAEKKGLQLTVLCDPQLPSKLKGDESRLRQVVTNLLSNAAKYTEKGSITLSFDSSVHDGQLILMITVKDTGIGISEENKKNLFTQFTRFDMEKNRNIEGTGLGLALSKRLIDLMQGTIEMQSTYGVGTSVTLAVPQQVIDPNPVGDFHKNYSSAADKGRQYQQRFEAPDARILVVDDVKVNLKVLVGLLKSTKIQADTASSGRQCLEMVTQTAYDLIFMDHMMPEIDGVETYEKMKKLENSLNKDTPVIMLTANAITGIREQFLEAGFTDYLSKPVNGEKLENMILQYLPKEKLHMKTADENISEGTDYPPVLRELSRLYPKVDLSKGVTVCNDSYDVYIDILKTYAENLEMPRLESSFEQKNAPDYQMYAHSIKSSSLSIGFSLLAEQALALENAAREEDWTFISANHSSFIEEFHLAVGAIKKAFHL